MRQASSPATRYAWPYANLVSRAGLATYAINVPFPALPPSRAAFKLVNRRHRLVILSREGAMLGKRKAESRTDPLTRSGNITRCEHAFSRLPVYVAWLSVERKPG